MNKSSSCYKIKFISGELSGRTFAVKNSGILIGRMRDADIRPGGTDIAADFFNFSFFRHTIMSSSFSPYFLSVTFILYRITT